MGEFWAPGAEIWLFKKKNMDRSIDLAVQHMDPKIFTIAMDSIVWIFRNIIWTLLTKQYYKSHKHYKTLYVFSSCKSSWKTFENKTIWISWHRLRHYLIKAALRGSHGLSAQMTKSSQTSSHWIVQKTRHWYGAVHILPTTTTWICWHLWTAGNLPRGFLWDRIPGQALGRRLQVGQVFQGR